MRPNFPRTHDDPVWYVAQSPQRLKRFTWISSARASAPTTTRSPNKTSASPRIAAKTAIGAASRSGRTPRANRAVSSPRRESSVTSSEAEMINATGASW